MNLEYCLCSAGVFTSCYMPEEGQCFVHIQRSMLDVCTMSGTIGSRQFIIQTISRKYSFLQTALHCSWRQLFCRLHYTNCCIRDWYGFPSSVAKNADFTSAINNLILSRKFRFIPFVIPWSSGWDTLVVLDGNNTRRNLDNSIPGCKKIREHAILMFHLHIKCP
jgi:hypothetical protein